MDDLTVDYARISDYHRLQRDGTTSHFKRFEFYIGKHGPFVEDIATGGDVDAEIARRVSALKLTLQTLPR